MLIMKFGGTSVADPDAITRLVSIVRAARPATCCDRPDQGPVVVVSALAGATDRLLDIAATAQAGDLQGAQARLDELRVRHHAVADMVVDQASRSRLHHTLDEELAVMRELVDAFSVLREVTPRSSDAFVSRGEILSSLIVTAACLDAGLPAAWVDSRRALVTTGDHMAAVPLMPETIEAAAREIGPILARGDVPVTGGFIGSTKEGVTTTLGRGGSDFSASIIGAALGADEIQIWTDVDGMLTADPRIVASPMLVPHLSFAEASELAYFGAKVLHPSTIQPAVERDIPVRILNSRRPAGSGTLITSAPPPRPTPVTALACVRDLTVIDITSSRMLAAHGFLRRLFEVFERFKVPVDVVTTSEVSVSVTINDRRRLDPLIHAIREFAEASYETDMALVCAVGENLRSDATLFAQVLGALEGVSLRMVSQAASRRNLTFVLPQADLQRTMSRLHERFFGGTSPAGAPVSSRSPEGQPV
jgi:aspartate kinase